MDFDISRLTTSGRIVKLIQVPEAYEDYIDVHEPQRVVEALKRQRARPDVFTFWQRLPDTTPKYDYRLEWDNVAALQAHSYKAWFDHDVHPSVRTKVRKAAKLGVTVQRMQFDDELVRGITEIFNETPIRQGRPYSHFGRSEEKTRAEWGIDLDFSTFFGALCKGELIGFVKLSYTQRYAEMSGTVCKIAHRDKSPMCALIAACVQFCEEQGIPYLCYGKFSYGKKGEDSLSDFKRHNGFRKIELPRYYVPLTPWGQIALSLGLHHGIAQALPTGLVQRAVQLRSKYYNSRIRASA